MPLWPDSFLLQVFYVLFAPQVLLAALLLAGGLLSSRFETLRFRSGYTWRSWQTSAEIASSAEWRDLFERASESKDLQPPDFPKSA